MGRKMDRRIERWMCRRIGGRMGRRKDNRMVEG